MNRKGSEIIGGSFLPDQEVSVKIYDFKKPDKFSKDQIRTVSIMHETWARLFTTSLSALLRSLVQVHVYSVDQLTYGEFICSVSNPTTLALVTMDPLKGSAILEIEPPVTFSLIDRLFGGEGESGEVSRDLTDIEQAVMEEVVTRALAGLRESWSRVVDLRPCLSGIETNPQFAQIVPPTEMIVLVTLEARINQAKAPINLCLPYLTIEPIIPKLSARYWYSRGTGATGRLSSRLPSLKVESELYFEAQLICLRDLAAVKKNMLIRLTDPDRAFLLAGNSPVLKLKRADGGGKTTCEFDVEPDGEEGSADLGLLWAAEKGETQSGGMLAAELTALRREMATELDRLNRSITGLAGRQEEMLDQLVFSSEEREQPRIFQRSRPFSFIRGADIDFISAFLLSEHPQAVAMILSYLEPDLAASILSCFPEDFSIEVVQRIASMDRIAPAVLKKVEEVLEDKVRTSSAEEHTAAGGVEAVAEILNLSTRRLEKRIIETLEKNNPALAEAIKPKMFVFEDIVLLEPKAIHAVLKNAESRDLLLSLKAVEERVKQFIFGALPEGEGKRLQQELGKIGRVRLGDVEAAQQRIVNIIRNLEESGAIVIGRIDNPAVD
jgi:flagellar motor switch protein FliM